MGYKWEWVIFHNVNEEHILFMQLIPTFANIPISESHLRIF